jgi:hypothetical protein
LDYKEQDCGVQLFAGQHTGMMADRFNIVQSLFLFF